MNLLDKAIGFFNPKAGLTRAHNRARMLSYESQVRRYEGAADGRRHSRWLEKSNPSVNQRIIKDLAKLVSRSRELTINNPYAKKAPKTVANNVVGTGILPTPFIYKIQSGLPVQIENADLISKIKSYWKAWADKLNCDYNGDFNFYGLQHLAFKCLVTSGEVLIIRKRVKSTDNFLGIQLLMIEADYIDTSKKTDKDSDGGYTFNGIKYNRSNKKIGYWIFDRHPSEASSISTLVSITDIVHLYEIDRPGQSRGVPAPSATILKQGDLDDYEDAELLGRKASACMPIFVQNSSPEAQADNEQLEEIEPGMVNYLNPGETVSFSAPQANPGYESYVKTQHRAVANGYDLTYEQYTGDLSNVNFSSGRMGWIEFQRQVDSWQYLLAIPKMCDKVFEWFVDALKVYVSVGNDYVIAASWTPPRREMIDPTKEINAQSIAVRNGFVSWQETVRANGYNPEDVIKELKEDHDRFVKAGLMPASDPYFDKLVKQNNAAENKK